MSWIPLLIVGFVSLLVVGIVLELRLKKGKHRRLVDSRPSALTVSPTTPTNMRTGEQLDAGVAGLAERQKEEAAEKREHQAAPQLREEKERRLEKQKRVRPWDSL